MHNIYSTQLHKLNLTKQGEDSGMIRTSSFTGNTSSILSADIRVCRGVLTNVSLNVPCR